MASSSSAAAAAAVADAADASSSEDAWDPWDRVPDGQTERTNKAYLKTQFTATSCGGLKCNTAASAACPWPRRAAPWR
jgi:hypothetical protein